MLFSPQSYNSLKLRLKRRYSVRLEKIQKEFRALPSTKTTRWMIDHAGDLAIYSSLHWYFLEQIHLLGQFLKYQPQLSKNDEFKDIDDEIFERWNKSEFADFFLKLLNQGLSISDANLKSSKILDQHLIGLGNFHLLKKSHPTKTYRFQPSLGDQKKKNGISQMLGTTLHLDGKELKLMTPSMQEMKIFSHRIELALKLIQFYSPSSWERFSAFTEVIIPIKQIEFVSYSHQELPGTSMINLYHRDFIDLLDDLIHENGHHHLNYYLNLEKLIEEPIDCIYYSPWRRTLRPLRGIYHAYFTFFWAFKLFTDIASHLKTPFTTYQFSLEEKEKIFWRAVEEYWMLHYSYLDLKWAYKNKLITKKGWHLIQEQQTQVKKFSRKILSFEKELKLHKQELKELKKTLEKAARTYQKN